MLSKTDFLELEPYGYGTINQESFSDYKKRLGNVLVNFPECVKEQWIYRHFHQFIEDYWFLDYETLIFNEEIWDSERLSCEIGVKSNMVDTIKYWGDNLLSSEIRRNTWLANFFLKNGTWPVPIIIFDNINNKIINSEKSFFLLEGHMRFAYFSGLKRNNPSSLRKSHKVWVVSSN